jgi:putative transposase
MTIRSNCFLIWWMPGSWREGQGVALVDPEVASGDVPGLGVGDREDEVLWRAFLRTLEQRGLAGMQLVISDQHSGLVAALQRVFQGVGHQRCRVHFARNLLALVPKTRKDMAAAVLRTIFAQPNPEAAAQT